jgi:hypothetical protein
MTVDSSLLVFVRPPRVDLTSPAVAAVDASSEERWPAWRARGLRHDRAGQRRVRLLGLFAALTAGLVVVARVIAGVSR